MTIEKMAIEELHKKAQVSFLCPYFSLILKIIETHAIKVVM